MKAGLRARIDRRRLRRVARAALLSEGCWGSFELGLLITDDQHMRRLHSRYLGVRSTTDVLAFPGEAKSPSRLHRLGDVVISYPQARRQSRALGHSVAPELDLLLVHGVLHLLGYRDGTPAERHTMGRRQGHILGE